VIKIYGLREVGQEEIRYVGKTINPQNRLRGHLGQKEVNAGHKKKTWVSECEEKQVKIEIVILEECDPSIASAREAFWIDDCIRRGYRLTNSNRVAQQTQAYIDW